MIRSLAIIPARGGSKRIPLKNIKEFYGKPIIAYSIEAAIASGLFDEVLVSTDDENVAEIALRYGASIPFLRSKKNADDHATISDVVLEVLENYREANNMPEIVGCILATAPFLTSKLLHQGFNKVTKEGFDSSFPIQQFKYPIFRALKFEASGLEMFWPEHLNSRSQDLPLAFHDAGQFYFAKTQAFLEGKKFFLKNSFGIEVSATSAIDIDTTEDWEFAEKLYALLRKDKLS